MNAPADKSSAGKATTSELRDALGSPRRYYAQAARLSLFIGVLILAPSWFMFEVYGRVMGSRNEATLGWLLLAAIGIYIVLELLEVARGQALLRASQAVADRLTTRVFDASFTAIQRKVVGGNSQGLADLRAVVEFIPSPAVTAVLDLPSSLLCLLVLFYINPWLGVLAMVSAAVQAAIGAHQERKSSRPYGEANRAASEAQLLAASTMRNAQVIESMGMESAMHQRWMGSQKRFMIRLAQASDRAGAASSASKMVGTLQGSLLLGLAVWLAVNNSLTGGAGMAIVASILGGRVLAPMAQMIAQWRAIGGVRTAYSRLNGLLSAVPLPEQGMQLPAPKGLLQVENVVITPPGGQTPVIKGVSFFAMPGELLTVIGPSAAGKTTLARALIGVWPSQGGKVRLDGADVFTWPKSQLGPHLGYLSQGLELFDGTVAENIARFGKVDDAAVRQAAEEVGITAMIEALPEGFDTQIGEDGAVLSGGQRQRIGLARAIYGSPRFVVLDEPNSSLDEAGERDLIKLLQTLKARGTTLVAITHRNSLLAAADKLLVITDGTVARFGPRDGVLAALKEANEQALAKSKASKPAITTVAAQGTAA